MAKRKRNIQILFCVSPEEKKLIRRKMIESKTKNMGATFVKWQSTVILSIQTLLHKKNNMKKCIRLV